MAAQQRGSEKDERGETMLGRAEIAKKLGMVFEPQQAVLLAEVVTDAYSDLVKTGDFNELKSIVKELAETQKELAQAQRRTESRVGELAQAQRRTESRVGELAQAQSRTESRVGELAQAQSRTEARVEQLAQAQRRTESRVEQLAEAQSRTEARMEELAQAQKETTYQVQMLTHQLGETNKTVGGLGQSFAYALENEAYRMMPAVLEEKHGIRVTERFVRTCIAGEEINLFGRGRRDGAEVLIMGESKLRLDERRQGQAGDVAAFEQLAAKAEAVRTEYPDAEIVLVLITHYARPGVLEAARERDIIVVQSFEW